MTFTLALYGRFNKFRMGNGFKNHWEYFGSFEFNPAKIEVADEFLTPLLESLTKNALVLDVGCGDGIHAEVIGTNYPHINYVGVDNGPVVRRLGALFDSERFSFVQGDALNMAFEDTTFDAVFSFGVLGYVSEPLRAFEELHRVLKPGGVAGIWLYPRQSEIYHRLHSVLHTLLKMLPRSMSRAACYALAPVLWVVPTKSNVSLSNSTWRECAEIVAVNLLYPVQFFTTQEIDDWYHQQGFSSWQFIASSPISVYGVKA